jgi:hypothetical protein
MKHEIIYTKDCALIVSELTSPGKEGQVFLTKENIIHTVVGWNYGDRLIIAHLPLTDAPILEGVPLLPELSKEDDVEELALRTYPFGNSERNALITGYNKAKETYKYTEEDLIKAIDMATTRRHEDTVLFFRSDEIIQSLQQPKRPKYFECEMEPKYKHIGAVKGIYGSGFRKKNLMYGLPKTITNSQGQKELVGSYIY